MPTPEVIARRKQRKKVRVQEVRAMVEDYKKGKSCILCGESHPCCLDFHHRDPSQKDDNVPRLAKTCGKDRVMKEIAKCDLLCANCHRKVHWLERRKVQEVS